MIAIGTNRQMGASWPRLLFGVVALLAALCFASPAPAVAYPRIAHSRLFELAASVHAESVTFGSDGALWFVGGGNAGDTTVVGRVSGRGRETEYAVSGTTQSFGAGSIAAGPDGALWFTEPAAGMIGRITVGGELAQFALPAGARPEEIVAGPDRALWFTEGAADRIGRITPSGTVSEFALASGEAPIGIALGPDRNLWFTLPSAGAIGRLTPAGTSTVFPLAAGTTPESIVAADGGLWFTERSPKNAIGRISTAGQAEQLPVPALFGTGAITAGPDGRIWFTTGPRLGAIEWIAPNGELGRRRCLGAGCTLPARSLASSPGGALWFGTGIVTCEYCGGGTELSFAQLPGTVGFLRRLRDFSRGPTPAPAPPARGRGRG